ncbi:hypothetical protein CDAR_586871 [Caerostris darwini]|uniref:Uncharacterized protein n=1 Tax=Caerostris darwini TaxID=1538125 RepID=A0AAV4T0U0_9ARAC|nr:hypothetical protein CDAR_586871 [Caerostris darwini]
MPLEKNMFNCHLFAISDARLARQTNPFIYLNEVCLTHPRCVGTQNKSQTLRTGADGSLPSVAGGGVGLCKRYSIVCWEGRDRHTGMRKVFSKRSLVTSTQFSSHILQWGREQLFSVWERFQF